MAGMCECRVTCNSLVDIMSDTEALCWTKGACPNEARVDRSSEYHVNKDKQGSEMTWLLMPHYVIWAFEALQERQNIWSNPGPWD